LASLKILYFIGRDTPSSQITEGEEGPGGVLRGPTGEPRQPLDFPPPPPNKQSRSDIDDKFGKFEIKKLLEGIFYCVVFLHVCYLNC
jgi:hypothetical protein